MTGPGGAEAILFVDDEPDLVDLVRRTLSWLGYRVEAFSSSEAALEAFARRPNDFDLVITDQTMPRLTGLDLAREIKSIRGDIPVILCTGYSETATPDRLQAAGITTVLNKPFFTAQLAEAVRRALG